MCGLRHAFENKSCVEPTRASRVRDVAVSRGASSQGDSRLIRGPIIVVLAASTMRRTRATYGCHEGWWSVFRARRTCTCLNSSGVRSGVGIVGAPSFRFPIYQMGQVGVMFEQALHESGPVL